MAHVRFKLLSIVILSVVVIITDGVSSLSLSSSWDSVTIPHVFSDSDLQLDTTFEKDFDWQLLNILKDEVQDMRKDLTASFIQEHSRKKRALEDYSNEAHLGTIDEVFGEDVNFSFKTDFVSSTATVFLNELYIFESDGIYKIKGLDGNGNEKTATKINTNSTSTHVNGTSYLNGTKPVHNIEKVFVSRWGLTDTAHVVATIERDNVLFILIEELHDSYSFLFTYAPRGPGLILRQRIRNSGQVAAAKFFIFYDQLYLIVASDNEVHSLTSCPVFKWAGTHLDEIHTVQTRGAKAVDTVVIEGHQYIAIAQAIDSAGNTEIGTQIVRMNRQGELEKVQLLYSNQPVQLHFTKVYHEYILVVAQKKESAIIYFYGGYDFIHLQTLKSIKGNRVEITSVLGPDMETYILASSGHELKIFMRASTDSPLTALMFAPYANNTYSVAAVDHTNTITGITTMASKTKTTKDESQADVIFLAVTWKSNHLKDNTRNNHYVEIYTLVFQKIPKVSGAYKQPDDKLSKCLLKLQNTLETSEPYIKQLQKSSSTILRKSADVSFDGSLKSQGLITLDSLTGTSVGNVIIKPNLNTGSTPLNESRSSPSHLQSRVLSNIEKMETNINPKLGTVLLRDETSTLKGDIAFPNGVAVREMKINKAELTQLNGIPWDDLRFKTLRTNTSRLQTVTGNWSVGEINSHQVHTVPTLGGIDVNEIFVTHSEPNQIQRANANFKFLKNVDFRAGIRIPPDQKINNIQIQDIINKSNVIANPNGFTEVTGKKTANVVKIESGTNIRLVNKVNLTQWYDSVLKTNEPNQTVNGVFTFNGDFTSQSVRTKLLNGKDWDVFLRNALLTGKAQFILNEPRFNNLHVDSLVVDEINGVKIRDLLNKYKDQNVTTNIVLDELIVHGDLATRRLNGVGNITQANVVKNNENSHIYSPVDFYNATVNYIELADNAQISGVDVFNMGEAGKTVTYVLPTNRNRSQNASSSFKIAGKILTTDADLTTVNKISIPAYFRDAMKISGGNLLTEHQVLRDMSVVVQDDFTADVLNGVDFSDYVKVDEVGDEVVDTNNNSSNSEEVVNVPLNFKNVVVHGKVRFGPGVTLNNVDLSAYADSIVHTTDHGLVHGVKRFTKAINAYKGIEVERINNYSLNHDFVMLRNGESVYDISRVNFTNVEAAVVVSHGPIIDDGSQDGLSLTELEAATVYINRPATIEGSVEFANSIETQELVVGGNLNNYSVAQILERYILLDSGNTTQYFHLNSVVEENLNLLASVQIGNVNGVDPSEYFSVLVNRSEDASMSDRKVLKGPVTIHRNLNCRNGTINDINLQELGSQAISKTKNQTITGSLVFHRVDAVNIDTASLCGIPVTDFVRIDMDSSMTEEVASSVHFVTNEITEVRGGVNVARKINGHNIIEITESLLTGLKGDRKFNNFVCQGDLNWNQPKTDGKGLTYLFNEAVRLQGDQNITGPVTFLQGFEARHIKTYPWLNGVDLRQIERDGAFGGRDLNFTGWNYMPELHIANGGSLEPLQYFTTNVVNGINLTELSSAVVRRNGTQLIRGTKTFKHDGLSVEHLFSNGVNGCSIEKIARVNDSRVIHAATFESVEGIRDLEFTDLNGFQWRDFLEKRVTLETPQVITGQWTIGGNVRVDDFEAQQLNGLKLKDVVLKNSKTLQKIQGVKTVRGLALNGDLRADSINGYKVEEIFARMLMKDEPRTILQTVYFEGPVEIKNDMHIEGNVNDHHNMDRLRHEFDAELFNIIRKSNDTVGAHKRSQELMGYLYTELGRAAVWLDYLIVGEKFKKNLGGTHRVEVSPLGNEVRLAFSTMIPVTENQCGLPNGCRRNILDFVELGPQNYEHFDEVKCKTIFDLNSGVSGRGYSLVSHVVSYNETCSVATDESTELFGMTIGNNNGSRIMLGKNLVGSISTGYITDAKIFNSKGIDYVVIAQFYDKNKGDHETEVFVYAIQNESLVFVQSIPSFGTQKLAIELMNTTWFLGVANSFSNVPTTKTELNGFDYDDHNNHDGKHSRGALSEIYVWIESQIQGGFGYFRVLREVVTQNVVDVEFIQVLGENPRLSRVTEEGLIAFAHSGNLIEIYKWSDNYMNFIIMQTIALGEEHRVTSLHGLAIKDVTYLVVSSVPQGLLIYEYRGLEDFKLYLKVPLAGVQDVNSFFFNGKVYLPIASLSLTFLAEAKIEGPAFS